MRILQNEKEECQFQLETQQQQFTALEKQAREKHTALAAAREQISIQQQVRGFQDKMYMQVRHYISTWLHEKATSGKK